MNQSDIDKLLKGLQVPKPPSADSVERAVQKACLSYRAEPQRAAVAEPAEQPEFARELLPSLLGSLLLIGLWWFFDPSTRSDLRSPKVLAAAERELSEFLRVFPDELVGVVESKGHAGLVLEPSSGPRDSQPLIAEIGKNGWLTRILTFSGKKLEVPLGKERLTLEFSVAPNGRITVANNTFVWSSDSAASVNGYRIDAHTLERKVEG